MSEEARLLVVASRIAEATVPPERRDPSRRPAPPVTRRKATIDAVNTDGTIDVTLNGTPIENVPVMSHLQPLRYEEIWLDMREGTPLASAMVGLTPWLSAFPLLNGATNVGSPFDQARYARLPGGMVALKGQVTLGASGVNQPMFVLDTELQPAVDRRVQCVAFNPSSGWVTGILYINRRTAPTNAGAVIPAQAFNSQQLALDGVSFSLY